MEEELSNSKRVLYFTSTHQETGTAESSFDHYDPTAVLMEKVYRPSHAAPSIRSFDGVTREFRSATLKAWLHARYVLFPADYRLVTGYFTEDSVTTECAHHLAVWVRLRKPVEPVGRLHEFLRAYRHKLRQRFEEDPTAVFPCEIWLVVINLPASDKEEKKPEDQRGQKKVHRRHRVAAFEKVCFARRVSPYNLAEDDSVAG
ncbi:hypothetical protein PG988_011497 [Apiospora saccharicola]